MLNLECIQIKLKRVDRIWSYSQGKSRGIFIAPGSVSRESPGEYVKLQGK